MKKQTLEQALRPIAKNVNNLDVVLNVIITRNRKGQLEVSRYGVMGEISEPLIVYKDKSTDLSVAVSFGIKYTGSRLRVHIHENVDLFGKFDCFGKEINRKTA